MKWTGLNELREKFLSFFESKDHLRLKSFPLVPVDDKSLLLINSGMAPMKKYFTNELTPPAKRVTSCQKCIRTPDIECVGITSRHGTYFEMLGNFSFGDYFKEEAIKWAWEFFTEVLQIPEEKIYISVYEKDQETYDIWANKMGINPDHLVYLGKEHNFWEHGVGPCGPCSEIYVDRGKDENCDNPDCKLGCECDRYVELWNLVFTQFESDGKGNYTPLENPNIDTGLGLERLAAVMQGVDNLFLVDTIQNIMKHISKITGAEYGKDEMTDISLRVVTDHVRSITFMIGDGVMPSNEGRGYVLRRLLRRAARHGKLLGRDKPFLYKVAKTVIKENQEAYPEVKEKQDFIVKMIQVEEENFTKTIDQGMAMLNTIIETNVVDKLSGEDAFKLNDTFGFPIDLTKEILAEKNISVDTEKFFELLAEQKQRSRDARKKAGEDAWISENVDLNDITKTHFKGYNKTKTKSKVLAIIKSGERVDIAYENESVLVILDKTPFYGESGGQVGDTGKLSNKNVKIDVTNTTINDSDIIMHTCNIKTGAISVGDTLDAVINVKRRDDIKRNHTGAHLLQTALKKVLGNHVEQAGQHVSDEILRFDFTHFSAMSKEEILEVEDMVNEAILSAIDVCAKEMPIKEAEKMGAIALFGEKYGDIVRVVNADEFSAELCGGTHVDNTSKIGLFKIKQESSIAAGVRRIEAVTGRGVINLLNSTMDTMFSTATALKINNIKELVSGGVKIIDDLKEKNKKIEELNSKISAIKVDSLLEEVETEKGIKVLTAQLKNTSSDVLHFMCDRILDKNPNGVAVFANVTNNRITLACACGKEVQEKGGHAGRIIKEVAQIAGGNGGGRPDKAMAGAKDVSKIDEALNQVKSIVFKMITN